MSDSLPVTHASQSATLAEADPELFAMIQNEEKRQTHGIELIASENFTSRAVMECLGSFMTNKYSEGYPGKRYYGGNEFIDDVERLAQSRALTAYGLTPEEWGVNVQPYSGSPANFEIYTALLSPHDRIMGLDLPSGGHLTHGFMTAKKRVSATSIYFESCPYVVDAKTGLIDYEDLEKRATMFLPKMIICGGSCYPREWDYKRFREIADKVGALLLCDMAHISGLVAAGVVDSPFPYAHIVSTTTHKSLRGPRSAMIFFRRDKELNFESRINFSVFPCLQGGPHNNAIAGLACQLKEVNTPEFKQYQKQVILNCQALANALTAKGHTLATGGTDNHLALMDLRPHGITGSKFQDVCDAVSITLNKNSINGDKSAVSPGGARIGSPAMTSRGLMEKDFEIIADFLDRCVTLTKEIAATAATPKLAAFREAKAAPAFKEQLDAMRAEVEAFAGKWFMPGRHVQ